MNAHPYTHTHTHTHTRRRIRTHAHTLNAPTHSVEYMFSRIILGMENSVNEITRRLSRTALQAQETKEEMEALPEVVRANLTAGLPLDKGASMVAYVDNKLHPAFVSFLVFPCKPFLVLLRPGSGCNGVVGEGVAARQGCFHGLAYG